MTDVPAEGIARHSALEGQRPDDPLDSSYFGFRGTQVLLEADEEQTKLIRASLELLPASERDDLTLFVQNAVLEHARRLLRDAGRR